MCFLRTVSTFAFSANNASSAYSYLFGVEGNAVADFPSITVGTGAYANNAYPYVKFFITSLDSTPNIEYWVGPVVIDNEWIAIDNPDGVGIYYKLDGAWHQLP